ncbi:MAG: hypothetical protein HY014_08370 [Acidobacteria bacterium]|nr:hypothetical protein [Acidobacteriota bacterium]MBI3488166.1 hypothetical protein [Acidobacteriota bacterium]
MSFVRLSHPKARALRPGSWVRALPLPSRRVSSWAVLLLWALVCTVLALLPRWWIQGWSVRTQDRWFASATSKAGRLAQIWEHSLGPVPAFTRGDEPVIRDYLAKECLTRFLIDTATNRVWVRESGRLRLATPEESEVPRDWAARATASGWFRWTPGLPMPKAWGKGASIVAFDRQWCLLKCWNPGSPEVERWLEQNLGVADGYRFGIVSGSEYRALMERIEGQGWLETFDPSLSPRTLQVTHSAEAPCRYSPGLSQAFGGNWSVVVMMSPGEFRSFRDAYFFRRRMVWLAYGALVGISAVGLSMFLFSQQRERIHSDHLASLAHSLKTPLAVLRSRCDTVLNGDLERETRQAQMLQIGTEIALLTRLIERGLEQTRLGGQEPTGDRIDSAFFESLDEELTPAFEARGRQLEVYCSDLIFHAPASALRTALVTLMENALLHGEGLVELRAVQEKGRILLVVRDEGLGLSVEVARSLQEGHSSHSSAQEASVSPGQHLGLLMLARLARNEGWGLSLENLEPGFMASLEIWI